MIKKTLLLTLLVSILLLGCEADDVSITTTTSPNIGEMSLSWLGDFGSHPSECNAEAEYDAYYNTTDGMSFFCDGVEWRMLAQNGTDGVDGINGTDGADGIDGKTIQVSDINGNLLGYSIDLEYIMSPNGYVYYTNIVNGALVLNNYFHYTYFVSDDCTGEGYVKTNSDLALRGWLLYDGHNSTYRIRQNLTTYNETINSTSHENECTPASGTFDFYKYDPISHADAGIPETITLPLVYEFKI